MFAKFAAVATCALLSSGCATYYRVPPIIKDSVLPSSDGSSFYDAKSHQIDTESAAFKRAFASAQASVAERNALVSQVWLLSDGVCLQHKAEIAATANSFNLTFGTLTTLLSGTASVIGAESTAKALAAGATASNSSRSLINEEVYQKTFAITILQAIDSERSTRKGPIAAGLLKSLAEYPIQTALVDLSEYHSSCSFIAGLQALTKALSERPPTKSAVESQIKVLRGEMASNDARATADAANAPIYQKSNVQLQNQIEVLYGKFTTARE